MREQLLRDRRVLYGAAAVSLVLTIVFAVAGATMLKRAINDSRYTTRTIDVPTQVRLLVGENQDPRDLINHIVYLHDVRLESGPTDGVYYAAGEKGERVIVVLLGSKTPGADDARVNISGAVRPLPTTWMMKKKWKLDNEEIKAVREKGFFIEADSIEAATRNDRKMAKRANASTGESLAKK